MKIKVIVIFCICLLFINLVAIPAQQTVTDPINGITIIRSDCETMVNLSEASKLNSRDERVELLWETSDPAAICGDAIVSGETMNSFARWQTNTERVSLFHDSGFPEWEHVMHDLDFDYPIDMTEDGSVLAVGDSTQLKIFSPDSSIPTWTLNINASISGLQLDEFGIYVYISFYDPAVNTGYVQAYMVGDEEMLWENDFEGGAGTLTLCEDGSTIIFTQYGGDFSYMWVMDTAAGNVIFQAPEYNQNSPAISADGSIIVNGDYSGYVWVYQYNENLDTYVDLWNYHVNGGGTSDWIGGMAISADGSTIAVGTLTFITNGFNGQVYLFDINSPSPMWVYEDCGDYVVDVDLSADGSLVAACGYGPYSVPGPDLMIFRRISNIPVFTLETPGSLFGIDLAADGSFCTAGGKAVHAREMGSGGNIYSVDCDLGGGEIAGTVNLEGANDNSGVFVEVTGLVDYFAYTDETGFYAIPNIPEGLYTIEYTKTGYGTISYMDGIVIEGQTTEIDEITLTPNGDVPLNLIASQATAQTVELNWEAPVSGEAAGYFVYRKRYITDLYPDEPLGAVTNINYYSDDTALPLLEYYYVVTAMTDIGNQSPYSNEAMGWTSSDFISDAISIYTGIEPTIDGILDNGEWDDAFCFDASDFWGTYDSTPQPIGSVNGYFKMNGAQTELYVAFENYNDFLLEDHDEVALYIDDNGDGVYPPAEDNSEGNYWAVYYAAGNELKFRPIYSTGGVGDIIYLTDPQVGASDISGYVTYEFVIPIGDESYELTPGPDNFSNIGIFVLDDNTPDPHDFDGWWPFDNIDIFDPAGYGNIFYGEAPQVPDPPANLTLEALPDDIFQLSWDLPAISDLSHFNIYFALNDEAFIYVGNTDNTSFDFDYQFYPQTSYSFYVTTVNIYDMESEQSEIVEYFTTSNDPILPAVTALRACYPNPFNPTTTVSFSIADAGAPVQINIYNVKGQLVKNLVNEPMPSGEHKISWNGKTNGNDNATTGVYFLVMKCGNYNVAQKILLMK